jgi:integrase
MHCDGGGLYLQVTMGADGKTPRKSWLFRFATGKVEISRAGKPRREERQMGLGSLDTVSLAEARERAAEARKQRERGIDPIDAKRDQRTARALAAAKAMTFDECRNTYIAAHRVGWRNAKHAAQWTSTLQTYVTPVFGKLPVQAVDVGLVTKVLQPLWSAKSETASRVRGRIERILDWAKVNGHRTGENPARWRGHLDQVLPARSKVRKVKHHAALPYTEIGAFMASLRERDAVAGRALEFAILTGARTGEVLGARCDEFDLAAKVWMVPADRMKSGREHRVPLSLAALAVMERMRQQRQNEYVFPGDRRDQLSNMAFFMLLRRMKRGDLTAHGFRATFKTWATERGQFPREVVEAALAHVVGDKVEAAYQRGDLFDKRRRLMDAWAQFCAKVPGKGELPRLLGAHQVGTA